MAMIEDRFFVDADGVWSYSPQFGVSLDSGTLREIADRLDFINGRAPRRWVDPPPNPDTTAAILKEVRKLSSRLWAVEEREDNPWNWKASAALREADDALSRKIEIQSRTTAL